MDKKSFFTAFYRMFYDSSFYKEVVASWKGSVFLFLFIILLVTLIPMSVNLVKKGNKIIKENAPEIIDKIPSIAIKDGVMEIDRETPYTIELGGKTFVVFDMQNKYSSIDEVGAEVLIQSKRLVYKKGIEIREVRFDTFKDFKIDSQSIKAWLKFAPLFFVALIVLIIIGALVSRIVQILISSLIGLAIASIVKVNLKFGDIFKLATITTCIGMILGLIISLFTKAPFGWLLFLISIGYLVFAINSNKS